MGAPNEPFTFLGHGANVVGSLGSGSLVQDMPSAMEFNGTTTHASSSATYTGLDGATQMTVAWWQKRGSNANGRIINIDDAASELFYARLDGTGDDSDLEVFVDAATDGFVGATTAGDFASDGTEWQHYAIVYDTAVLKMYRNGINIVNDSGIAGAMASSNGPLYMGSYHSGGTPRDPHFDGSLRDMRIFTSGLSATQVTSVFEDTGMNGIGVTPVNWYYMEEGTGATLNDSGSANIDLGIVSGSWDVSMYNLNQIGLGSISGAATISGGTWNLRDSTSLDFDGGAGSNNYVTTSDVTMLDGLTQLTVSGWLYRKGYEAGGSARTGYFCKDNAVECWVRVGSTDECGMGINNDHRAFTGIEVPQDEWTHVVMTYQGTSVTGDANDRRRLYLNGVLESTISDGVKNGITDSAQTLFLGGRQTIYSYSGSLRDIAVYDTALTQSQIDLLFAAQWNGSPVGWWKLNEGTGDTVVDSGPDGDDGTITNATWVNPEYEATIPGAGTIFETQSGTKLEAPRGVLNLWSTDGGRINMYGHYIHNSGTFQMKNSGYNSWYPSDTGSYGYSNTFYKVRCDSGTVQWFAGDWTIEHSLILNGGFRATANSTKSQGYTMTLGTTGASGYISGSQYIQCMTTNGTPEGALIQGASTLYPAILSGTDGTHPGIINPYRSVQLSNLQIDGGTISNQGTSDNSVVTVVGDVSFTKGYELNAGDQLIASGQRVEIGGLDSGNDAPPNHSIMNFNDSLVYLTDRYDSYIYRIFDNSTFYTSGSTFVMDMSNAGDALGQMQTGQHFDNVAIINDGLNIASHTLTCTGNLIIAAGGGSNNKLYSSDGNSGINVSGNVSITNGATYEPDDDTATIGGNFNMAGGFIGQGALDLDESEKERVTMGDGMATQTAVTLEAWVNPSTDPYENTMIGTDGSAGGILSAGAYDKFRIKHESVNGSHTDVDYDWVVGKWQHMCFTWDGTTGKAYADGKLLEEWALSGTPYDLTSACIGSLRPNGDWNWDGKIARSSLWKAALTESEIREMMFYDWAAVSGSSIDQTDCVGWYEFSDNQEATSISDMSGSGNTGTLVSGAGAIASTGGWAGPGAFQYDTSTLIFNKAGTCNLYGHQDGTATNLYSLTVTNGTTLETYCKSNDFIINSGATLVNSGTLNSNRNWQYKSPNMPIVGASSDLTVGNNIFYYFPPAVSGAGTEYRSFQPGNGVDLYMQGDFTAYSIYPYSDSIVHFNGYKGTAGYAGLNSYSSGNVVLEPGSSISFPNASLRGFYANNGGTESYITANGEAAAIFNGGVGQAQTSTLNGGAFVVDPSELSISGWYKAGDYDPAIGNPTLISRDWAAKSITFYADTKMRFQFKAADDSWFIKDYTPAGFPNTGEWHHYGVTFGSDTMTIYWDGVSRGTVSMGGEDLKTLTEDWYLGSMGGANEVWDGALADTRIYSGVTLSDANMLTLSSENPATSVSGAYADPDNALGATTWWKLNATALGILDSTDSVGSNDAAQAGGVKSGFVTISGATGFNSINNPYEQITLTNTYISGMADIVVGETSQGANTNSTLITKGTVVLD